MKRTGLGDAQQRQMSRQIDPLQALQILSTIKQNTALSQTKIQDYFGKNNQSQDLVSIHSFKNQDVCTSELIQERTFLPNRKK